MAIKNLVTDKWWMVTVFNARVFAFPENYDGMQVENQFAFGSEGTELCTLDTLKISNLNAEGPTLSITGGQDDNTLIKRGKKYRLEMQDALGSFKALEIFGLGKMDGTETSFDVDDSFAGVVTIVGETYVIDQKSGENVPVYINIYQFLPDSIMNLTMDASASDGSVFDLNGDIIATVVKKDGEEKGRKMFYSISDQPCLVAAKGE